MERAKTCLAIAESQDSKREAYRQAAEEIAAHIEETGDQQKQIAAVLQYSAEGVSKLLKWREAGYPEGTTPFTMADPGGSKPTDRAAVSHAKKVLREAGPEQLQSLVDDLPEPAVRNLADAAAKAQQNPAYRAARDEHDRHEREMPDRERHERIEAADKVGRAMDRLAADFVGNKLTAQLASIPEQVEEIANDVRDAIDGGQISDEMLDEVERTLDALPGRIEEAIRKVRIEITVARGVAGLE